jgi:hypothetical protein
MPRTKGLVIPQIHKRRGGEPQGKGVRRTWGWFRFDSRAQGNGGEGSGNDHEQGEQRHVNIVRIIVRILKALVFIFDLLVAEAQCVALILVRKLLCEIVRNNVRVEGLLARVKWTG